MWLQPEPPHWFFGKELDIYYLYNTTLMVDRVPLLSEEVQHGRSECHCVVITRYSPAAHAMVKKEQETKVCLHI